MLTNRVQLHISKLVDACSEGLIDKHEFEPRIRGARQHLEKLQAEGQAQEQLEAQLREMRLPPAGLGKIVEGVEKQPEHRPGSQDRRAGAAIGHPSFPSSGLA